MASRNHERPNQDRQIWNMLLEMMGETIQQQDCSFFCPPETPCHGGDAGGDYCKACWFKAVLERLSEGSRP